MSLSFLRSDKVIVETSSYVDIGAPISLAEPLHSQFIVNINYQNYPQKLEKKGRFKLQRDGGFDPLNPSGVAPTVERWLDKLGMVDSARKITIDAIVMGFIELLNQVSNGGLRSLAMFVQVEVLEEYEEEASHEVMVRSFLVASGFGFNSGPGRSESDPVQCCMICLEDMVGPTHDGDVDLLARLPCSHVFHGVCLFDWLRQGASVLSCPLCRFELFTS